MAHIYTYQEPQAADCMAQAQKKKNGSTELHARGGLWGRRVAVLALAGDGRPVCLIVWPSSSSRGMEEGRWREGELLAGAYTEVESLAPSPARGGATGEGGAQIHRRPFAGWRWRPNSSPSVRGLAVVPGSVAGSARGSLGSGVGEGGRCGRGRGRHGSGVGESGAAREGRGRCEAGWGAMAGGGVAPAGLRRAEEGGRRGRWLGQGWVEGH